MKKLMALIALVAMVAVSSVAYAQTGTTTINATVTGTRSITGCTATLGGAGDLIVPSEGDRQSCNVTYINNVAAGYGISYEDGDANTTLQQGILDSIAALVPSAVTATYCGTTDGGVVAGNENNKGTHEDCWSFSLGAKSDANATYETDGAQGPAGTAFNVGEHAITASGSPVPVLDNAGTSASGTFNVDFWFEVQVDDTTQSGAYTNATTVTIGA